MKNEKYIPITLKEVEENYIGTDLKNEKESTFWNVYSPEIVEIINTYVSEGNYPYNGAIEDLVQSKLFPSIEHGQDNRVFSHIVYTSQRYRHDFIDSKNEKEFEEQMIKEGYIKATKELFENAKGTTARFLIVMNGTTILGTDVKKKSEQKFKIADWGEQGYYWMNPRASRKGYRAHEGQFCKLVK